MVTNEQAKEAMNTLKSMCKERYREDEYGDMACLDCQFYRITDGGVEYCHLTGDGDNRPVHWDVE